MWELMRMRGQGLEIRVAACGGKVQVTARLWPTHRLRRGRCRPTANLMWAHGFEVECVRSRCWRARVGPRAKGSWGSAHHLGMGMPGPMIGAGTVAQVSGWMGLGKAGLWVWGHPTAATWQIPSKLTD